MNNHVLCANCREELADDREAQIFIKNVEVCRECYRVEFCHPHYCLCDECERVNGEHLRQEWKLTRGE